MRTLFVTHQNAFQLFGGAETALLMWRHYLEKEGVACKPYSMYKDDFGDYDIVFLHNIPLFPNEAFRITGLAKGAGAKVVLSPIFWNSLESSLEYGVGARKLAHLVSWLMFSFVAKTGLDFGLQSGARSMKLAFEKSDAIVVNSLAEVHLISSYFSIPENKIHVVYNGVDPSFQFGTPERFVDKYHLSDFILFVGRIEPRKNVLRLIKSFNKADLNTDLVIIGKPSVGVYESYWAMCSREATKNAKRIHFLGPLDHSGRMLKSAYAASRLFTLPSFYETPGLSALEAALAGSSVVITNRGATQEYFSNLATYINPSSVKSIVRGLTRAYYSPRNERLKEHILRNFTWQRSANQLLEVLKSVQVSS